MTKVQKPNTSQNLILLKSENKIEGYSIDFPLQNIGVTEVLNKTKYRIHKTLGSKCLWHQCKRKRKLKIQTMFYFI